MPIQSRLLSIPTAEMTRVTDGTGRWLIRVHVRRRGEVAYTNLSNAVGQDWVVEVSTRGGTPDSPVTQITLRFTRQSNGRSLAPGITTDPFNQVSGAFKPFLHPDAQIIVDVANLVKSAADSTALWRRWLECEIQKVEWPAEDVVCICNSLDYVVENADIEKEEVRGAPDPGIALGQEIQGLLTGWVDDPVTLYAPDGDGIGIGEYKAAIGKVGAQIRALAARQAWDVRYYWDSPTESYRYTLYEPPRDKTTPDIYLTPSQVREIPGLEESNEALRNDFELDFVDSSGRLVTRTYRTTYPAGSPSYRRQWMRIVDTEVIKTIEQADALLAFASNDLSLPLAQKRVRLRFNPYFQIHDLIEFSPDDIRFDTSTHWAVVGVSHGCTAPDKYTDLDLRGGGPVGQYYAWHKRVSTIADPDPSQRNLYDFAAEGTGTGEDWTWKQKPQVHMTRGAVGTFDLPEKRADKDELLGRLAKLYDTSIFVPYPPEGKYTLAYVEPYDSLLRKGQPWQRTLFGTPPEVREKSITVLESADGTQATVHAEMIDPRGVLSGCNVYLQSPDESGLYVASLIAPLTWEFTYTLPQDHGVYVRLEFPRNDGGEAYAWGPNLSDSNKIPGIPRVTQVWDGTSVQIRVDGDDTDTVALFYRPVVAGVMGSEVAIPPRGTDPRYGAYTVTAGPAELRYYIYGKNAAGEGGPLGGWPYKDEKVAIYYPPTLYAEVKLVQQAGSNATQTVIQADTIPSGGTVKLDALIGSATLLSGPAVGVTSAAPQTWTFGRGAINSGSGQARFVGAVSGYQQDSKEATIEEQGRDTVPLVFRAKPQSSPAGQLIVRAACADPYPSAGRSITITYTYTGVASVSPASGQVIAGASVTSDIDTTGYVDFTINLGDTQGRVSFTATATDRLAGTDAVDPASKFGHNGQADVLVVDVANSGATAHLTTHHDPETKTGAGAGQYRVDGGSSTTFTIDSNGVGTFSIARSSTAIKVVEVRGSLADGVTWGPWYARNVDRYDPPAILLSGVTPAVEDNGYDDIYTIILQGSSMAGQTAEIQFYRGSTLRSTQTFAVTEDNSQEINWTDTGAGNSFSDTHYVIVQLYNSTTGTNYGAPVRSRTVNSVI